MRLVCRDHITPHLTRIIVVAYEPIKLERTTYLQIDI